MVDALACWVILPLIVITFAFWVVDALEFWVIVSTRSPKEGANNSACNIAGVLVDCYRCQTVLFSMLL